MALDAAATYCSPAAIMRLALTIQILLSGILGLCSHTYKQYDLLHIRRADNDPTARCEAG